MPFLRRIPAEAKSSASAAQVSDLIEYVDQIGEMLDAPKRSTEA